MGKIFNMKGIEIFPEQIPTKQNMILEYEEYVKHHSSPEDVIAFFKEKCTELSKDNGDFLLPYNEMQDVVLFYEYFMENYGKEMEPYFYDEWGRKGCPLFEIAKKAIDSMEQKAGQIVDKIKEKHNLESSEKLKDLLRNILDPYYIAIFINGLEPVQMKIDISEKDSIYDNDLRMICQMLVINGGELFGVVQKDENRTKVFGIHSEGDDEWRNMDKGEVVTSRFYESTKTIISLYDNIEVGMLKE